MVLHDIHLSLNFEIWKQVFKLYQKQDSEDTLRDNTDHGFPFLFDVVGEGTLG